MDVPWNSHQKASQRFRRGQLLTRQVAFRQFPAHLSLRHAVVSIRPQHRKEKMGKMSMVARIFQCLLLALSAS